MLPLELTYAKGRLAISGLEAEHLAILPYLNWDESLGAHSCEPFFYRELISTIVQSKWLYQDLARQYGAELPLKILSPIVPRPHQAEALRAWKGLGARACISLPTGAGKTILAVLAIAELRRSTLVIVPTIDLLNQWVKVLGEAFDNPIGALGGGQLRIEDISVATYDSALIYAESLNTRFGFLVVDECHHLAAPQNRQIALQSLAPFRLGLSATIERTDGGEDLIYELLGPLAHRTEIKELTAKTLAPYEIKTIKVELSPHERADYDFHREVYLRFMRRERISLSENGGWKQFIMLSAMRSDGKAAMEAYQLQKKIPLSARSKITLLWQILQQHEGERVIVFTQDNAFAYEIGEKCLLPVLTHRTKAKERAEILKAFRSGELECLVTSKVLNEGVDVPEAAVAVVLSGGGTVREHVQRLGRILRHREGKKAILYEVVSEGTHEIDTNRRRRQHNAYQ